MLIAKPLKINKKLEDGHMHSTSVEQIKPNRVKLRTHKQWEEINRKRVMNKPLFQWSQFRVDGKTEETISTTDYRFSSEISNLRPEINRGTNWLIYKLFARTQENNADILPLLKSNIWRHYTVGKNWSGETVVFMQINSGIGCTRLATFT